MTANFRATAPVLFIPIILLFCACSNDPKQADVPAVLRDSAGFEYHHSDASTAPPYHRSYTIRVRPGRVWLEIVSYGDILLQDSSALTRDQYLKFAEAVSGLHILFTDEKMDDDCTGGSAEYLDLFTGTKQAVSGKISHCGSTDSSNLKGDTEACIRLFTDLVPDLDKKIASTREK